MADILPMPRRKYDALKGRLDYLRSLPPHRTNRYDNAEMSALDWVLTRYAPNTVVGDRCAPIDYKAQEQP